MERYGGYTWRQDHDNVIVQIPIPAKMSSKADLDLVITNTTIKAGVKGQPPQLEVSLRAGLAPAAALCQRLASSSVRLAPLVSNDSGRDLGKA